MCCFDHMLSAFICLLIGENARPLNGTNCIFRVLRVGSNRTYFVNVRAGDFGESNPVAGFAF